jgi:DtxR family Mn-dependent transcriptional regulator
VIEALDRHLGRPAFDPHGDPIPGADGLLAERNIVPLATCRAGQSLMLAQVLDQREETLRYLDRHGLGVGTNLAVISVEPGAGVITVRNQRRESVALSEAAALRILVQPVERQSPADRARAR